MAARSRGFLWGVLGAIAGCGAPHAIDTLALVPPSPCDPARWALAAATTHHAWLVSAAPSLHHRAGPVAPSARLGRAPLAVLDVEDDDVLLADIRPGAIVARWSPRTALGRAVVRETLVSPRRGAPGDPAVRVTLGYPLAAGGSDWVPVAPAEGVSITGWVPAHVRGTIWETPVQQPTIPRHDVLTVLRAPDQEAAVVAGIAADAPLRFVAPKPLVGGWFEVTIATEHATIHGFVQPPPPRPMTAAGDDVEIEYEIAPPPAPYPVGTCLRDEPNGTVVGMVRGPVDVKPVHEIGSWYAVVMPTVWGDVTLYVDGAPALESPASKSPNDAKWPAQDAWWNDYWRSDL